ncbi:hypothetical protein FRB94_014760 [Tulasnella sp. JGI-2019a]|nr:hypothetical protein FRB94_014760 [Tulasnella sp. JGI-2019a]
MAPARGKKLNLREIGDDRLTETVKLKDIRPTKRKKTTQATKDDPCGPLKPVAQGKGSYLVGKLAGMMYMPVDIFSIVCLLLTLADLLALARTSRRLRGILVTREWEGIWRGAREFSYPTLPACPADLCEPQYANLMFTSTCQGCGTRRATKTDYSLRIKYCRSCWDNDILFRDDACELHGEYRHLFRYAQTNLSAEVGPYLKSILVKVIAEQDAITGTTDKDKEHANAVLIHKWTERCKMMVETGKNMQTWQDSEASNKRGNLEALYARRLQSIKGHLFSLGYTEADLPIRDKAYDSFIRRRTELTPQNWERIRPGLEALVGEYRDMRIRTGKATRTAQRRFSLLTLYRQLVDQVLAKDSPDHQRQRRLTYPDDVAFLELPQIVAILDGDTDDVSEDAWQAVADDVRYFILVG